MKKMILDILSKYLEIYDEKERQKRLLEYLSNHNDSEIVDWNNFDGHIVAGAFIYAKEDGMFLVLYHKDLKMYLYPGGHVDANDMNPLSASRREVLEETGLTNLKQLSVCEDELIPIDIDTHMIGYNERLKIPEHYHYDFRYLFTIDKIEDVNMDSEELDNYKWISMEELEHDPNYGRIVGKIKNILDFSKSERMI